MTLKKTTINCDEIEIKEKIRKLVFFSDEKWLLIPEWAHYFFELGSALSCYSRDGCRFIAAVTLPARSFASSLISSGIILPRVSLQTNNLREHILALEALPVGSPIKYRNDNRQYSGVYKGSCTRMGVKYFIVNHQKGGEINFTYENSYKIEITEKAIRNLPKIQSGRRLDPPSPLLQNFLVQNILERFLAESRLECVILGQQVTLRDEICDLTLGYQISKGQISSGKIIDFVRAKGSQFQITNLSFRSYILSSSGKYNQQFTSKLNNYVTIFDNPLGFLKWRKQFLDSNWIVVLDKTDRNFDLALMEINQEYQNRIDKPTKFSIPKSPLGIDLMLFEENK